MPVFKIEGTETVCRYINFYVEADSLSEAEDFAGSVPAWSELGCITMEDEEVIDGEVQYVEEVDIDPRVVGAVKAKWNGGVAVVEF